MNNSFKIFFITFFLLFFLSINAQKNKNKKSNKKEKTNSLVEKKQKTLKNINKKNKDKKEKRPIKKDNKKGKKSSKYIEQSTGNDEQNIEQKTIQGARQMLSKDTSKPNVVTITSAFKPVLRTAAKINFAATTPDIDTTKLQLNYNIPAQNLLFTYQPVAIKPLSLSSDSSFEWRNNSYIKLGAGNLSTIYAEAAASFGHPNKIKYNLYADYIQGKGNQLFQEYTKANVKALASVGSIANHDLNIALNYQMLNQYKYGFKSGFVPSFENLKQNFNSITFDAILLNKVSSSLGINYKPSFSFNHFFDNNNAKENNLNIGFPITKNINDKVAILLNTQASLTNFKKDSLNITNNIFEISPSVNYKDKIINITLGFKPIWDNNQFNFIPNVTAKYKLNNEKYELQVGWQGNVLKNNFKSLATTNPFIASINNQINTTLNEQFLGIKGSFGKHFSFNAQVSIQQYKNLVLFVNDSVSIKSQDFLILHEPKINAFKFFAEVGYTDKERLSILSSLQFIQFGNQQSFTKPFGIIPMQLTTTAKYKILKDVYLKSDIFLCSGNFFRVQTIQTNKTPFILDFNIGTEITVMKRLNLFLDINNLFNNRYQRWNQYNVLGFNVVAGFVYSFK